MTEPAPWDKAPRPEEKQDYATRIRKHGVDDDVRLLDLAQSSDIPLFSIINKYDICHETTARNKHYFIKENIPLLGKIPFDTAVVKAMLNKKSIIEYVPTTGQEGKFV